MQICGDYILSSAYSYYYDFNTSGDPIIPTGGALEVLDTTCPTPEPCPPDLNSDGVLDNGDINTFVTLFLAADPAADINNDGILDNGDINAFVAAFLAGC